MKQLLCVALLLCACKSSTVEPDDQGTPADAHPVLADLVSPAADGGLPPSDLATDLATSDAPVIVDLPPADLFTVAPFAAVGTPTAITLVAGETKSFTLDVTRDVGFSDLITITLEGLPASVTTPATSDAVVGDDLTATFALTAAVDATSSGPHTIVAHLTAGAYEKFVTFALTVSEPADYALSVAPTYLNFPVDAALDLDITIGRAGGFADDVVITFPDLPSTLHATGTTLSGTTTHATIAVDSDEVFAIEGGSFTVHAAGGGIERDVVIGYNLNASVDYAISASPTTVSVSQGTSGVVTVQVDRVNGYNGQVSVTATGLPSGVTVIPNPLVIEGALASGTLTIHVDGAAAVGGPTTISLEGASAPNGNATTRSTTFGLDITAAPSFTLDVAPTTINVAQGTSANATLTIVRDSGFSSALTTTLLTPPTGVTATGGAFSTSALTSTLAVSAAANALLLVPTAATISTGVGGSTRTQPVTITVTPKADDFLDTTFGTGGAVVYGALPLYSRLVAGRVFANGKALGITNSYVVAFTASGAIDTSFGTDGMVGLPLGQWAEYGFLTPSGDAYAAARSGQTISVGKVLANGTIDTSFGTAGVASFDFAGSSASLSGVAVRGDGAIFVYGSTRVGATDDFAIAKLTTSGALDTTWGGGDGKVEIDFGGSDILRSVVFGASNKVVLVGESQTSGAIPLALARLSATGTLDTGFDSDGILTLSGGMQQYGYVVAEDTMAGKLLIAGYGSAGSGAPYLQLTRIGGNGALDTTFGTNGFAKLPALGTFSPSAMIIDSMGAPVLVGTTSLGVYTIAKLTTGGALDATFSTDGIDSVDGGAGLTGLAMAVAPGTTPGVYWTFGALGPRAATVRFLAHGN